MMQATCYGALRTVTGSMHLVAADGTRILLDWAGHLAARGFAAEVPLRGQSIAV